MLPVTDTADWRALAACRGMDTELFFTEGSEDAPANASQIAKAKRVCSRCTVTAECLADAGAFGVRGGMSEDERRDADRKQRRRDQRAAARERRLAA